MFSKLVGLLVILALASAACANGGTVQVSLTRDDANHTFAVYATDSTGDNLGIEGIDLNLQGFITATLTAGDATHPAYGNDASLLAYRGFTSSGLSGSGPAYDYYCTQNIQLASTTFIYGIGQTSVSLPTLNPAVSWGVPALLFSGTFTAGQVPTIVGTPLVDTFNTDTSQNIVSRASVTIVPEPATLALLGASGLALLRRRR